MLPAVTVVSFLPGSLHPGCCVSALGLRFALPQDVAASFWPAVAAAALSACRDVAASSVLTVAAAAIRLVLDVAASPVGRRLFDVCVLFYFVAGAEKQDGVEMIDTLSPAFGLSRSLRCPVPTGMPAAIFLQFSIAASLREFPMFSGLRRPRTNRSGRSARLRETRRSVSAPALLAFHSARDSGRRSPGGIAPQRRCRTVAVARQRHGTWSRTSRGTCVDP